MKEQRNVIVAFKKVFGTEDGKTVLETLEKICHFKKTTFTGDARASLVAEGRRQVYLQVLHFLELDIDKMDQVIKERMTDET